MASNVRFCSMSVTRPVLLVHSSRESFPTCPIYNSLFDNPMGYINSHSREICSNEPKTQKPSARAHTAIIARLLHRTPAWPDGGADCGARLSQQPKSQTPHPNSPIHTTYTCTSHIPHTTPQTLSPSLTHTPAPQCSRKSKPGYNTFCS